MSIDSELSFKGALVANIAEDLKSNREFKSLLNTSGMSEALGLLASHFKWVALNHYYDYVDQHDIDFGLANEMGENMDLLLTKSALLKLKNDGILDSLA